MTIIEAIILGLIQGLTEFIPISSTAHLTLAGKYMGLIDPNNPEKWTAFVEAVIQDITTKKRWLDTGLIASIFIKELYIKSSF